MAGLSPLREVSLNMQTLNMLLDESTPAPGSGSGLKAELDPSVKLEYDTHSSFTRRRSTVDTLDECLRDARGTQKFAGMSELPSYMPEESQYMARPSSSSGMVPRQISLPVDFTTPAWEEDPLPQKTVAVPSFPLPMASQRPACHPASGGYENDPSRYKSLIEQSNLPFPWHQHLGELRPWRPHPEPQSTHSATLDRRGSCTAENYAPRSSISDDSFRVTEANEIGVADPGQHQHGRSSTADDRRFSSTSECPAVSRHNDTRATLLRMRHNAQSQMLWTSSHLTGEDTVPSTMDPPPSQMQSDHDVSMDRRSSLQSCESLGSGEADTGDVDYSNSPQFKRQQRARKRYAEQQEKIQSLEKDYAGLSAVGDNIQVDIGKAEEEIERLSARETELLAIQRVFDAERRSLEQKIKVAKTEKS